MNERVSQYNTTGPVGSGKWQALKAGELAQVYGVAATQLRERGYLEASAFTRVRRQPRVLLERMKRRVARAPITGNGGSTETHQPSPQPH